MVGRGWHIAMGAFLASGLLLLGACERGAPPPPPRFTIAALLGEQGAGGFARATAVRPFRFPADHGPHPGFRSEWWYLTGNLRGADGREYGFQATFFRFALAPGPVTGDSAWRGNQVWMAHAALSDPAQGEHLADERFSREGPGLAGARAGPFRVWLDDWRLGADGMEGEWRLQLPARGFTLDLRLRPASPVVLQGDRGLSRKGAAPGNASYYYSIPRLQVEGRIRQGERGITVTGLAWLDREWSSSALEPQQAGWDWFSLQLRDGRNLMFYRLRRRGGGTDPHSGGSLSDGDGLIRRLGPDQVRLTPLARWRGYPVEWRLQLAGEPHGWRIRPLLRDQEMRLSIRYWEGAVEVIDEVDGTPLGRGYLELTGYRPSR